MVREDSEVDIRWKTFLKALLLAAVWIEFPFWFFIWLILSIIRLDVVRIPWEGMMKGTLETMYAL